MESTSRQPLGYLRPGEEPYIFLIDVSNTVTWTRLKQFQDVQSDLVVYSSDSDQPFCFLSHRWLNDELCDTEEGELLRHLQSLNGLVWIDYCCLPQRPRTEDEQKLFDTALKNMQVIQMEAESFRVVNAADYFERGWCLTEYFAYMTRIPITSAAVRAIDERVSNTVGDGIIADGTEFSHTFSQWNILELLPTSVTHFMSLAGVPTDLSTDLSYESFDVKRAMRFLMDTILEYDEKVIREFDPEAGDSAVINFDKPASSKVLTILNQKPTIRIKKGSGELLEAVPNYKLKPLTADELNKEPNEIVLFFASELRSGDWIKDLHMELSFFDQIRCTNGKDMAVCKQIVNNAFMDKFDDQKRKQTLTLAYIIRSAFLELHSANGPPIGERKLCPPTSSRFLLKGGPRVEILFSLLVCLNEIAKSFESLPDGPNGEAEYSVTLPGEFESFKLKVWASQDDECAGCVVTAPINIPEAHRPEVAQFLMHVNTLLKTSSSLGSMEIDLEDGAVRSRSACLVQDTKLSSMNVFVLIAVPVLLMKTYLPIFARIIISEESTPPVQDDRRGLLPIYTSANIWRVVKRYLVEHGLSGTISKPFPSNCERKVSVALEVRPPQADPISFETCLVIKERRAMVLCFAAAPVNVQEGMRAGVAKDLMQLNSSMRLWSFEIDPSSGKVWARLGFSVTGSSMTPAIIAALFGQAQAVMYHLIGYLLSPFRNLALLAIPEMIRKDKNLL